METELRVWEYNWYRMKEITIKHEQNQNLLGDASRLIGGYQSFVRPDRWADIVISILAQEPPRKINISTSQTTQQMRKQNLHTNFYHCKLSVKDGV